MLKTRYLAVAAAMALTAWTAPSPAWTAPDWPEPAPLRGVTLNGSDTKINLDTDLDTSPAGPSVLTDAGRADRPGAGAYEPDARGTPTTARPPTTAADNHNKNGAKTKPAIEPGSRQPSREGSPAAMNYNHRSTATPTASPSRANGSQLGRQHGKEAPGLARQT